MAGSYTKVGRVSTESVFKGTGKHWEEWIQLLDKAGGRTLAHGEIAALLKKKYKLTAWWQHGVAHGYEVAIGRRIDGQDFKGRYMVTSTKSVHLGARPLWSLLVSEEGMKAWLQPLFELTLEPGATFETEDGYFGEVRTLKKERRVRLSWRDPDWDKGTYLELLLVPRLAGKPSILVFNHTQIPDVRIQARLRKRWKAAVERLMALIET